MTRSIIQTIAIIQLLFFSQFALSAQPIISLSSQQAGQIGQLIWQNEGAGKVENLTVWNTGEAFPSFGIGHFIWYPADVEKIFTESFPQLLQQLKQSTTLPDWLDNDNGAPWPSRDVFYAQIDSTEMRQLRQLLQDTVPQQVEFIVLRLQASLPGILDTLPTQSRREHVTTQFYRVARQPTGVYALIDYVNFKGEGISARERYLGQGWGLLQVLETMDDEQPTLPEFVRAADFVLTRRVQNAPRDESRWLPGWRKRLQTYLKP